MDEFSFIDSYIQSIAESGITDNDGYALTCHNSEQFVISKDIIVEGVHFLHNTAPELIASKALRVNLSDIAAMGVKPYGYLLGLVLSKTKINQNWLRRFTTTLDKENKLFEIKLLGGDTTTCIDSIIIISITIIGITQNKCTLSRSTANISDYIYVSGNIGDASLGLIAKKQSLPYPNIIHKYDVPEPRISLGITLSSIASSCIDISDGLIQDANHICKKSGVGMIIYEDQIPTSKEFQLCARHNPEYNNIYLNGGDDYELLFTINKENASLIQDQCIKIGEVVKGSRVEIVKTDGQLSSHSPGFTHF